MTTDAITPEDIYLPSQKVAIANYMGRKYVSVDDLLAMLYKAQIADQHPAAKQAFEMLAGRLEQIRC